VVAIVGTNFSEIVFSIPGVRVLKSYSPIKQAFYDYKVNVKVPSLESRFKEYVSLKEKD
jgi:PP-loop superfamily ATP-utilizing enzyme